MYHRPWCRRLRRPFRGTERWASSAMARTTDRRDPPPPLTGPESPDKKRLPASSLSGSGASSLRCALCWFLTEAWRVGLAWGSSSGTCLRTEREEKLPFTARRPGSDCNHSHLTMPTATASAGHPEGFGFWVAVCCTLNAIMGTGFLTLPWAFAKAGKGADSVDNSSS